MQSEETDGSKDVPPLSYRGSLVSSRFTQLNTTLSIQRHEEVPA